MVTSHAIFLVKKLSGHLSRSGSEEVETVTANQGHGGCL